MLKDALLQLGLTADQADKVLGLHEEAITTATKDLIPKEKLAEVNTEKEQLTTSLAERDQQLKALQTSADASEGLKTKLAEAIAKNEADSKQAAADLADYKKNNALDLALVKAGAKNPKAARALLDLEKVSLDGENLIGLSDQLEVLKTSDGYLFDEGGGLSGRAPSAGSGGSHPNEPKDNPFKKETYNLTKQAELYKKDLEQAKRLAAAAGVLPAWLV